MCMLFRLVAVALMLSLAACSSQPEPKVIPAQKDRIPPPTKS